MSDERRDALKIIGTIGATCAFPFGADELYGQSEHTHAAGAAAKAPAPAYFSKADLAAITAMAALIIPATDTPGAVEAGVPAFIDFVVGRNKELQPVFASGLRWLADRTGGRGFAALGEAEQLAILRPLCEACDGGRAVTEGEKFFAAVKALTADGYWTSREGMGKTLGFAGGAVLGEYPECREH